MDAGNFTAGRGRRGLGLAAVALSLLATGCTMCPDPFDYAGPVPNGSVSQNDYAARSNGILPVRATPLPWPPIVQSSPRQPTLADDSVDPPATITSTAPGRSPVVDAEVVPVVGASLEAPVGSGDVSPEDDHEPTADGQETGDDVAGGTGFEPARGLWPASRRMTPTPVDDPAEADLRPAAVRESRLPREMPPVLVR